MPTKRNRRPDTVESEVSRWHRVSDGAIGPKYPLATLFLATVAEDLKDQVHDAIIKELEENSSN